MGAATQNYHVWKWWIMIFIQSIYELCHASWCQIRKINIEARSLFNCFFFNIPSINDQYNWQYLPDVDKVNNWHYWTSYIYTAIQINRSAISDQPSGLCDFIINMTSYFNDVIYVETNVNNYIRFVLNIIVIVVESTQTAGFLWSLYINMTSIS